MMMANLGLIMNECLGSDEFAGAMDTAVDMVLNKFYSPDFGLVFENMPVDSSKPDLESSTGRQMNPGHVLEAMWFLLNYLENVPGSEDKIQSICRIISTPPRRRPSTTHECLGKRFPGFQRLCQDLLRC